jgi:hypothetical protein
MTTNPIENFQGRRGVRGKQRLPNLLLEHLVAEWEEFGPQCLRLMRQRDPVKFVQMAYSTLPRDILVSVEQRSLPGGIEADDWALMRQVLELIKSSVPADSGAGPREVFSVIETALRQHYAKPINKGKSNGA